MVSTTKIRTHPLFATQLYEFCKKMHVHGMDVKNASLNSKLDCKIYKQQPEGFIDTEHPEYVCKLNIAVYGLKKSPRQWYNTIKPVLESVGVEVSRSDSGLFSRTINGSMVLLGIYVDDLIIACECPTVLERVKSMLSSSFAMKDLGILKHYLGIDISYDRQRGSVAMCQSHLVLNILRRFDMESCKPSNTPMEAKLALQPHVESKTNLTSAPYRQLIGSIMYLMLCTRPELSFSIGSLSKFLSQATDDHWKNAKRVLRYLKGTANKKLIYRNANELPIMAYCDADWASAFDRKSTSGYVIFLGGNLISWASKKQTVIALSSTEAEIIAAAEAMREILWVRNILSSFGITVPTPVLYCDSQPAIFIANNGGFNGRSKHMDLKYKFFSECVSSKDVKLVYISTSDNVADTLTKSLPQAPFNNFSTLMGLRD